METHRPPSRNSFLAQLGSSPISGSLIADSECGICSSPYGDPNTPSGPVRLHDNHIFCRECAETWLQQSDTCPTCRRVLFVVEDIGVGEIHDYDPTGDSAFDSDSGVSSNSSVSSNSHPDIGEARSNVVSEFRNLSIAPEDRETDLETLVGLRLYTAQNEEAIRQHPMSSSAGQRFLEMLVSRSLAFLRGTLLTSPDDYGTGYTSQVDDPEIDGEMRVRIDAPAINLALINFYFNAFCDAIRERHTRSLVCHPYASAIFSIAARIVDSFNERVIPMVDLLDLLDIVLWRECMSGPEEVNLNDIREFSKDLQRVVGGLLPSMSVEENPRL